MNSDLEKFIELVAWGGCTASGLPEPIHKYSLVCHIHRDHVVSDPEIIVVGPEAHLARLDRPMRSKYPVVPGRRTTVTVGGIKARIYVLGRRTLKAMGVNKTLHAWMRGNVQPLLIVVGDESALYIDDFDVDDVEDIKKIIKALKNSATHTMTTFIMPVYSGATAHGAKDPKELVEASRDLMLFAMAEGLKVVALAHPAIPPWVPNNVKKLYKTVETFK